VRADVHRHARRHAPPRRHPHGAAHARRDRPRHPRRGGNARCRSRRDAQLPRPYYEFGAEISRSAIREATHPDRGPVKVLGNPIHLDGETQPDLAPAPGLGADTDAVFRELLGMDPEEVARLREAGVV